jgi:hypothetical protein
MIGGKRDESILSPFNDYGKLVVEIEKRQDCSQIENYFQILCLSDTREVRKN